jgi:hypothetical protein
MLPVLYFNVEQEKHFQIMNLQVILVRNFIQRLL